MVHHCSVSSLSFSGQLFVADRRVDEEIGSMYRFFADPDELLPHVMNFGRGEKVVQQHAPVL